jgi:MFS transporter, DHA3 family, macrolide efflux protein
MFLSAILLALIVGWLAGGGLPRLAHLRLRWFWLLAIALAIRLVLGLTADELTARQLPIGLAYLLGYALVIGWLIGNWRVPGLQIAAVGIVANTAAIALNGGQMPIWSGAFAAAGFGPDDLAGEPFHFLLVTDTVAEFIAAGGLLGDVVPIPIPLIRSVVSLGDILLAIGIFWTIVYSMTRPGAPVRSGIAFAPVPQRAAGAAGSYEAGVAYAGAATVAAEPVAPATAEAPPLRTQSPYLRLVLNRNFSLLWVGQVIAFFGDRIHQLALIYLVSLRGSELEVGLTFAATALPNVFLGPVAGAFVDRWDRRRTMIGCDIVRAGLVLMVPFAIEIDIALVYLIAFGVATVTLLFRPAKTAVVPQIVERRDLVTANSANTVGETSAELIGNPIAGLIVLALSGIIIAAFALHAITYLISALLIFAMVIPKAEQPQQVRPIRELWLEIIEGWRFLRGQAELFANTLLSVVGQISTGVAIVVSALYAQNVLDTTIIAFPGNWSLLLASISLGSIVGGLGVGAIAPRLSKGPVILVGYVAMGITMVGVGFVNDLPLALALFFGGGVANMLVLVPSITLFQERTPQRLMGRVVSTRQALVFGAIAASMGVSGWLAGIIGPSMVFILAGAISATAGGVGFVVPALRNAR